MPYRRLIKFDLFELRLLERFPFRLHRFGQVKSFFSSSEGAATLPKSFQLDNVPSHIESGLVDAQSHQPDGQIIPWSNR